MKRILSISVIVVIAVLLVLYIAGKSSDSKTANLISFSGKDADTMDADNDQLPDWEEALWKTDPNNPDSDGDGISDGEEVEKGTDPLNARESALLHAPTLTIPGLSEEKIAKMRSDFYTDLLKERGEEIREETLLSLVSDFEPEEISPRYTLDSLSVLSKTDAGSIKTYGNRLGLVFSSYSSDNALNEEDIIRDALENDKPQELSKLILIAKVYESLGVEILALPTPLPLAEEHLALANGYDVMARSLVAIASFFEDPIQGGGGYQSYLGQTVIIKLAIASIADYIRVEGVAYSTSEPGYFFSPEESINTEE